MSGRRGRSSKGGNVVYSEPEHSTSDIIAEDDICPVCQLLLCQPVTTQCNHTLCESCMATWAEVSVSSQMQIVDVDEEPTAFDTVSGLEARCPMCRTQTTATLNRPRARALRRIYPSLYAERVAEEQSTSSSNHNSEGENEIQTMTLYIGNRHHLITPTDGTNNQHDWTFFVRPSRADVVEEVHIDLHPTFRPPRVIKTRQPYEVRRLGWGYFTITAHIMLKPGYSWVSEDATNSPHGAEKGVLPLNWNLDFAGFGGRGSMGRLKLKMRHQRAWDSAAERKEEERAWSRLVRQYEEDGLYQPDEDP